MLKCLAHGSIPTVIVSYGDGIGGGGGDCNHKISPIILLFISNINPDNISVIVQQNLYPFTQHILIHVLIAYNGQPW